MLQFAVRNRKFAMLFNIALMKTTDGKLRAIAPDLPDCELSGDAEHELLPRLRLLVEDQITCLLMANKPLPDLHSTTPPPDRMDLASARWLSLHINMAHLEALARHQGRR